MNGLGFFQRHLIKRGMSFFESGNLRNTTIGPSHLIPSRAIAKWLPLRKLQLPQRLVRLSWKALFWWNHHWSCCWKITISWRINIRKQGSTTAIYVVVTPPEQQSWMQSAFSRVTPVSFVERFGSWGGKFGADGSLSQESQICIQNHPNISCIKI